MQYTRFLCPPLSPRISSRLCPLSWWGYLTILSSAVPFSFCLQSFPASEFFPVNQLFASDGQIINISPSNEYSGWFSLGWTGLISLQSKKLSRVFSSTTSRKHQFFGAQPSLWFNSHICTWWGKGQGGTNWEIGIDIYTLLCVTLFSFLYLVSHVGSACVSSRSVSLLWPQNVCV